MRVLALTLPALGLIACASHPPAQPPGTNLPPLALRWSLPEPKTFGYVGLVGDLLLGWQRLTAVNIRSHQPAFKLPLEINIGRTSFAAYGEYVVAVTGKEADSLSLLTKSGEVSNTVAIPEGAHDSLFQVGPVVADRALYVVSGPNLYKYRTSDLLIPGAAPEWIRTYPGYGLGSLAVQDEDHVFVSTNAETSRKIIALDARGHQRWSVDTAPATQAFSSAYVLGVYKDTLIAAAGAAGLQAYNTTTGAKAWSEFPSTDTCPGGRALLTSRMTIADDKVFLGPFGGTCVLAFHADTGKVAWVFDAPNRVTFDTTPLYLNGVVYATNSRLWAIDADTGTPLAVGREDLTDDIGSPLAYDPVEHQILEWGATGVHAYRPLR